jgi:hypothetical protein
MQALRSARRLAQLLLALFVLVVGIAAAAPAVQPERLEMVCSGGSVKLMLVAAAEAEDKLPALGMDCPLCGAVSLPPVAASLPVVQPLAHAVQSIPAARIAALTAAPLPARGPPTSS